MAARGRGTCPQPARWVRGATRRCGCTSGRRRRRRSPETRRPPAGAPYSRCTARRRRRRRRRRRPAGPRPEPGGRRVAARVPAGPASSAPQSRAQGAPRSAQQLNRPRAGVRSSSNSSSNGRGATRGGVRGHRSADAELKGQRPAPGQGPGVHRVTRETARAGKGGGGRSPVPVRRSLLLHTSTPPAPRWQRSCSRCLCHRCGCSRGRRCRLGWARSRDAARGEPEGGRAGARARTSGGSAARTGTGASRRGRLRGGSGERGPAWRARARGGVRRRGSELAARGVERVACSAGRATRASARPSLSSFPARRAPGCPRPLLRCRPLPSPPAAASDWPSGL
ncbi:translation initiation factor IF-2-like [Mus musculus]|jgi:hypothetical protein|uniref:translation initiation factor IF-2-like n=1 Tax=Mus musculus TaxID=10090 RepID=UPI001676E12B|nr:translation initiation factor IF-2-like [Mus musculus]